MSLKQGSGTGFSKPHDPAFEGDVLDGQTESIIEDSEYDVVRAAVPATDGDVPVNTVRAWFLAVLSIIILSGLDQFFQMHNPPIAVSPYLVILLGYPVGRLWEKYMPSRTWSIFGKDLTLNPGPFNTKEHSILAITVIGSLSFDNGSVASDVWNAMIYDFDIKVSLGFRFLFLFTSQALALGLIGVLQHILVDPAYCVWPAALPTCTLLHSLHRGFFQNTVANGWKISRMGFFWLALAGMTIYQFIPGFLFTGLSGFAWITWIAPNNVKLNQVFGSTTGMDLLPLTLDWNSITAYNGSPLIVPLWAIINVLIGFVVFLWIIGPALHWSNTYEGLYLPYSSSTVYDNTGAEYDTARVMNADFSLNETAYHAYSPIYLSTTTVLSYGMGLAVVVSAIVHISLYYGREVVAGFKETFARAKEDNLPEKDIHNRMMQKYQTVPTWWYVLFLAIVLGLSILFVEYFDTGLPWWGIIIGTLINVVFIVPIGIVQALCNISISTGVIFGFIGGFIWPNKMVALIVFKILTYNVSTTALMFGQNMKLGRYMKIPPRLVFTAQLVGLCTSCIVQLGVNTWALGNVKGICTVKAIDNFVCPIADSFVVSMTFWGLIGPKKLFSSGTLYNYILYFFLAGALGPIVLVVEVESVRPPSVSTGKPQLRAVATSHDATASVSALYCR